jgi:hypothetical protein
MATQSTAAASETPPDGRAARVVKQAGGVVGGLSALVGLVFLLFPQITPQRHEPPPEKSARISGLVSNPHTTRGQFLDYSEQSRRGFTRRQLAVVGASAFAQIEVVGYRGVALTLERQIIDAVSGEVVGEARDFEVVLEADRNGHPWWDWEPLRPGRGSYVIVMKVLDTHGAVLACEQSDPYGGQAGLVRAVAPRICPRTQ